MWSVACLPCEPLSGATPTTSHLWFVRRFSGFTALSLRSSTRFFTLLLLIHLQFFVYIRVAFGRFRCPPPLLENMTLRNGYYAGSSLLISLSTLLIFVINGYYTDHVMVVAILSHFVFVSLFSSKQSSGTRSACINYGKHKRNIRSRIEILCFIRYYWVTSTCLLWTTNFISIVRNCRCLGSQSNQL